MGFEIARDQDQRLKVRESTEASNIAIIWPASVALCVDGPRRLSSLMTKYVHQQSGLHSVYTSSSREMAKDARLGTRRSVFSRRGSTVTKREVDTVHVIGAVKKDNQAESLDA